MQKIREAERASVVEEYGGKEGDIVHGVVQRIERGNLYVDLGRATGIMPYHEQIPGERYRAGERIRAYLFSVREHAACSSASRARALNSWKNFLRWKCPRLLPASSPSKR